MEMNIVLVIELLLLGAVAGFLAGLLSIGGGFIVVPGLLWVLSQRTNLAMDMLMPLVLGTSMATIVFSAWSAQAIQRRNGTVREDIVRWLRVPTVAGVALGALLGTVAPAFLVKVAFGLFCLYAGIRMAFLQQPNNAQAGASLAESTIKAAGVGIGTLCGLLSVGGANVVVPYLLRHGVDFKRAAGTATALQVRIGIAGAVAYVILGLQHHAELPTGAIGYVHMPALAAIALGSIFFARVGAQLQARVRVSELKRAFGLFTTLIGVRMCSLVIPEPWDSYLSWSGAAVLAVCAAAAIASRREKIA